MTEQFNDIVIMMVRIELAGMNFFDGRSKVGKSIHVFIPIPGFPRTSGRRKMSTAQCPLHLGVPL